MNKVMITGHANGLGRELALIFLKHNYIVYGLDIVKPNFMHENLYSYRVDLSQDFSTFLEKFKSDNGKIDMLINNAGINVNKMFHELDATEIENIISINLKAPLVLSNYSIKYFGVKQIINISSLSAFLDSRLLSVYAPTKSALNKFTNNMNMESKVKVLSVCPAFLETELIQVGQENGFPSQFRFLLMKPSKCASIIYKHRFDTGTIFPGFSAKLAFLLRQFGIAHIADKILSPSKYTR